MSQRDDPDVRRSGRTRTISYKNLDENRLMQPLYQQLIEEAERYQQRERSSRVKREREHELSGKRYPSRHRTNPQYLDDFDYDEEIFTPIRQKSVKRRRIESTEQEDQAENDISDSASPRRHTRSQRKVEEPFEGPTATPERKKRLSIGEPKSSEKENAAGDFESLADRIKNKRNDRNRRSNSVPIVDKDVKKVTESASEESEEEEDEPRQYKLRQNRAPVDRFSAHYVNDRPKRKVAMGSYRSSNRRPPRDKRKRRYSSSSTGSSDEELQMAKRDAKDEGAFLRRQLKSLSKNRHRLAPVNLTEKDLGDSKHLFKERLRQMGGSSCTDIDPMGIDKDVKFDQVGGLTSHLQSLKETVLFPLLYPELFDNFKIAPPKGILFYGPPGTGKTLVARALANECSRGDKKVAFFMRKGADCLSKWVGESERQLRLLFDQAYSMRPSIIFFDEIDGLCPVRSSRQDQIHSSIVSTMLALLDGIDSRGEVVVIGATNRLDSIDPALRRPGRFDRELPFTLPDKTARKSILEIHTKAWNEESKPADPIMDWLSETTSGYCGADLRSLCTEAVLVAIRGKFPHIYLSEEKLNVNPKEVKVDRDHFVSAMRNIVPACRRDVSIVSKQVHPRLNCLLTPFVEKLFAESIPSGYVKPVNIDNLYSSELEKVVRALDVPPSVPAGRLLLHGEGNQGQTHYFLPVIANRLDHLPMHCVSCVTVFSAVNPDEAMNQMLHSAIRSTSKGSPTVLLLPDLDVLEKSLPASSWNMLVSRLESFVGFTTLLMVATVRQPLAECSEDIKNLFGLSNMVEVKPPVKIHRKEYFHNIIAPALKEPFRFNPDDYPVPPKAAVKELTRKLNAQELKALEETFSNKLRQFRIFLREMLGRLIRDRRFNIFNLPVAVEDAEDYYEVIKNPLCLTDMMAKINRKEYSSKSEFLNDIQQIRDNAIEYNPDKDLHGRMIRNSAFCLMDMAEALFEEELDDDFSDKLDEMKQMIDEAKTGKCSEKPQVNRRTRQSVLNGFKEGTPDAEGKAKPEETPEPARRVGRTPKNKKKCVKLVAEDEEATEEQPNELLTIAASHEPEASNDAPSVRSDSLPEVESMECEEAADEPAKVVEEAFVIDREAVEELVSNAARHTKSWSIPQLESLGAAMSQLIERYSDKFDRAALPGQLTSLLTGYIP